MKWGNAIDGIEDNGQFVALIFRNRVSMLDVGQTSVKPARYLFSSQLHLSKTRSKRSPKMRYMLRFSENYNTVDPKACHI